MFVGHYEVLPITIRSLIRPAESKPNRYGAEPEKKKSFLRVVHYLYMKDLRSGIVWKFTGSTIKGILSFSDGRNDTFDMGGKPSRMTQEQLTTEVGRLLGSVTDAALVVAVMLHRVEKGSDVRAMLDTWDTTINAEVGIVKARHTRYAIMSKH